MLKTLGFLKLMLHIAVLNAQSVRQKVCCLHDTITERGLDLLILTETWIKKSEGDYGTLVNQLCPQNYRYIDKTWTKKGGGGIGIVYRQNLKLVELNISCNTLSFEHLIVCCNDSLVICAVYRPPKRNVNDFLNELDMVIAELAIHYTSIILCGDVNIHLERTGDRFAQGFLNVIADYSIDYHIGNVPTHNKGGSLDVLCSRGIEYSSLTVQDTQLSDHYLISCLVGVRGKHNDFVGKEVNVKRRSYQFRDYKALDCPAFVDFIDEECCQRLHECSDVDVYARTLDSVLLDGLDKFAPCSTRLTNTAKSKLYKYDRSVAEAKAIRRKLERIAVKSNQVVDKQLLKAQRYKVRKLALKSQGTL